jgi:hypothetical protein
MCAVTVEAGSTLASKACRSVVFPAPTSPVKTMTSRRGQSYPQGRESIAMTLSDEQEGRVGDETKGGPVRPKKRLVHRSARSPDLRLCTAS